MSHATLTTVSVAVVVVSLCTLLFPSFTLHKLSLAVKQLFSAGVPWHPSSGSVAQVPPRLGGTVPGDTHRDRSESLYS